MLVLKEGYLGDDGGEFANNTVYRYRVLRLSPEGVYTQQVYTQVKLASGTDWAPGDIITPTRINQTLNEIPFVFAGPNNTLYDIDKPPMEDLVNVNLSHFRTSADLENGRHWTGLPTPILTGFEVDPGQEVRLSASGGLSTKNPNAKAFFMEFQGQGLDSLVKASKEKCDYMAALGARLLNVQATNETAEAARIRVTGESATLTSIANTVAETLTLVLQWMLWWNGVDDTVITGIKVILNTNFIDKTMNPQMFTALLAARQAGEISQESFLWNLKDCGLLSPETDIDAEIERIATAQPTGGRMELGDEAGDMGPTSKGGKQVDGKGAKGSEGGADAGFTQQSDLGQPTQIVKAG